MDEHETDGLDRFDDLGRDPATDWPGDLAVDDPDAGVDPARRSGLHPVNVTQLVMGVAFAGLLAIWALFESGTVGDDDFRWLLPLPWIAAGVAGLAAAVVAARKPRGRP